MFLWTTVQVIYLRYSHYSRETSKSARDALGSALRDRGAVRSALQGFFLRKTTGRAPSRALSGALLRAPRFLRGGTCDFWGDCHYLKIRKFKKRLWLSQTLCFLSLVFGSNQNTRKTIENIKDCLTLRTLKLSVN